MGGLWQSTPVSFSLQVPVSMAGSKRICTHLPVCLAPDFDLAFPSTVFTLKMDA